VQAGITAEPAQGGVVEHGPTQHLSGTAGQQRLEIDHHVDRGPVAAARDDWPWWRSQAVVEVAPSAS
jgi:hypothetical protein